MFAILMAATLAVGTFSIIIITKTAFASNNGGNTVTAKINSQSAVSNTSLS
jgi:hypothetical protein